MSSALLAMGRGPSVRRGSPPFRRRRWRAVPGHIEVPLGGASAGGRAPRGPFKLRGVPRPGPAGSGRGLGRAACRRAGSAQGAPCAAPCLEPHYQRPLTGRRCSCWGPPSLLGQAGSDFQIGTKVATRKLARIRQCWRAWSGRLAHTRALVRKRTPAPVAAACIDSGFRSSSPVSTRGAYRRDQRRSSVRRWAASSVAVGHGAVTSASKSSSSSMQRLMPSQYA